MVVVVHVFELAGTVAHVLAQAGPEMAQVFRNSCFVGGCHLTGVPNGSIQFLKLTRALNFIDYSVILSYLHKVS